MFKFIKNFIRKHFNSYFFIAEDPDEIELDVLRLMKDEKFMVDLNVVVLAYVVLSNFEPEIATFIHAMRGLRLTAQEFSIIMIRSGSAFQFLAEHKVDAIEKAKIADFSAFSNETVEKIRESIKRYEEDALPEDAVEDNFDTVKPKKQLSQDELANKLIDEYLKGKKNDKEKDKDKDN